MVTLRRLLLEFGIVGDQAVKQKMREIQIAATESKKTLLALNQQIEILNRANLGGLNIPTTGGAVLTTSEQHQARYIAQQQQQEKRREEQLEATKLEVANEQIKATKDLLRAINTQIDTQKQSMSQFFKQFEMQPAFEGAHVARGKKGQFVSMKGAKVAQQIKEKFEETIPTIEDIGKQHIQQTKANVQKIKAVAPDIEKPKIEVPNITETKSKIQEIKNISEETDILDDLQAEINKLKRPTKDIPLVKPFIPERETGTVDDFDEFLEEAAKEIKKLKESRDRPKSKQIDPNRVLAASNVILGEIGLQSPQDVNDPQINVFDIIKRMENERERKEKIKKISDIKGRLSEEYQRADIVRERGFAVRPVERARQMQEFIQEKAESARESIRKSFIGFGKRIGLLESPEEFEKRRMVKFQRQAEEAVKKPEVQKIINISFKDTTIDNKNREKMITERLTQALRGL